MRHGFLLRGFNTWNVGGACELYLAPHELVEASVAIRSARAEGRALYVLGGGSNVLIGEGLLSASVIHTVNLSDISVTRDIQNDVFLVRAGAGVSTKRLLALALENGWGGLEFLTGIPGTIGGALWGNAGAAGEGLSGVLASVEYVDFDGNFETTSGDRLDWRYRRCPLDAKRTALVGSCLLKLTQASRLDITERMRRFALLKRGQPLGKKTAGCVFKNPAGDSAGRLLDLCGCKGLSVGGAVVSEGHANFIENRNDASADDIYRLCELCRARVLERYGVELEYEIRFIGGFEKV